MDVVLMRNSSPNNQVAKNVDALSTISGTLRSESSIIDPVILVQGDVSSFAFCNYCYIAAFGRYYYINNIVSVRNNLFEIHAHVDVLMTYQTGIKNNSALVRRQQNDWNLLINDGSIRTYANAYSIPYAFPNGFNGHSLVLCVAGPQTIT